jgi:hypothetical protein
LGKILPKGRIHNVTVHINLLLNEIRLPLNYKSSEGDGSSQSNELLTEPVVLPLAESSVSDPKDVLEMQVREKKIKIGFSYTLPSF